MNMWGRSVELYSYSVHDSLNPSNAEATLSKEQESKVFWKPSKACLVGIQFIALAEYFQMSTHVPGFQSIFRFFTSYFIDKISHQQNEG